MRDKSVPHIAWNVSIRRYLAFRQNALSQTRQASFPFVLLFFPETNRPAGISQQEERPASEVIRESYMA